MINKLLFTALLFIFTLNVFSQVPNYVPTNGLVGYWPFNGNANDESGNGNNGTVNGATLTTDRFGNANSAYNFDGQSYISVPHTNMLNFGFGDYSLSVWANKSGNSWLHNLIAKATPHPATGWCLGFVNSDIRFLAGVQNSNSLSNGDVSYGPISNGEWNNYIAVFNPTMNSIKIYKNGQIVVATIVSSSLINSDNIYDLMFGVSNPNGAPSGPEFFQGFIDEVGIWNRALTQQEITNLYTSTVPVSCLPAYVPTSGLVGYWPFCGNANDESGNGNNGTVNGATLTTDRFGNANSAYSFDGVNDWIEVADNSELNPTAITIAAWVKALDYNSMGASMAVNKGWDQSAGHYDLLLFSSNHKSRFVLGSDIYVESSSTVDLNEWVFLTASISGLNAKIYVNGVLENSTTLTSNNSLGSSTAPLYFGKHDYNGAPYVFNGILDDISIYNRALTPAEITQLYTDASVTPSVACTPFLGEDQTVCAGTSVQLNVNSTSVNSSLALLETYSHDVGSEWTHNFSVVPGQTYTVRVSAQFSMGTVCPNFEMDPAYWIPPYNGGVALTHGCNSAWYIQNYCNGALGMRPTPDVYNPQHTYDYPIVANSNVLTVGFADCCLGDNCGSISFELHQSITSSTYLWSNGATTPTINVSPTSTTTYTCTVTTNGVSCTDSVTVVVNNPTVDLGNNVAACGTSTTLTAPAGFDSYLWSNGATTNTTTVIANGIYSCTVTQGGCSATDSIDVTLIDATITASDSVICAGESVTLSVPQGGSSNTACASLPTNLQTGLVGYWPFCGNANDASGNGNNGTVNGPSLTTDRFGNANSAYFFNKVEQDIITIPNSSIYNFSSSFSVNLWYKLDSNQPQSTSGTDYNVFISKHQGGTLNSSFIVYTENVCMPTTYMTTVNDVIGYITYPTMCNTSDWHMISMTFGSSNLKMYFDGILYNTYSGLQNVKQTILPLLIGESMRGNIDDIVMWGRNLSSAEIQQLYNQNQATYSWSPGGATTPSINVSPTTTTTYTCTTTTNGVSCTDSVTVVVNNPTIDLGNDVTVCGTSTTLSTPIGYDSYLWSNGATTNTTTVSANGTYSCTVTQGGCSASDSIDVTLIDATISASNTSICSGEQVNLLIQANTSQQATTNSATELWFQTYLQQNAAFTRNIIDGNSLVVAGSYWPGSPGGTTDQLVTKLNCETGNLEWQHVRSPGGDHDGFGGVQKLANGNYIFFGQQNAQGTQYFDGFWSIYNPNGIEQSYGMFSVPGSNSGSDVQTLPNGNLIFSGNSGDGVTLNLLNQNLSTLASQTFFVGSWNNNALAVSSNRVYSFGSFDANYAKLACYDFNLSQQWILELSNTDASTTTILDIVTSGEEIYLVGSQTISGLKRGVLFHINSSGQIVSRFVDSNSSEYTSVVMKNQNCLISRSNLTSGLSVNSTLLSFQNDQLQSEVITFNGGGQFVSYDMRVDGDFLYATGVVGPYHWLGFPSATKLALNLNQNYIWSNGATTPSINVSPTSTTTYSCTTTINGVSCTDSVTVVVNNPTINLGNDVTVCGTSTTLTAPTGYDSYVWSNGATTNTTTVSANGTYSCMVTQGGCSASDTLEVVLITLNAQASSTSICAGASVVLTGSSNLNLNQNSYCIGNTGSPNPWPYPSAFDAGIIDLGNIGAQNVFSISAWVNAGATQNGISILLDASHGGSANWVVQAFGNNTYTWGSLSFTLSPNVWQHVLLTYVNGSKKCYIDGQLVASVFNPISYSGSPQLYLGNWPEGGRRFNGLVDELYITYSELQSSNFVPSQVINAPSANSFGLWHFDEGSNGTAVNSVNGSAAQIGSWFWASRPIVSNATISWDGVPGSAVQTVSPMVTTTYISSVTMNSVTCSDSVTVVVNNPTIDLGIDVTVCGTSTTLTAPSGYDSYLWSNGATTNTITVSANGTYSCTATQGGCSASDSIDVTLIDATISASDSVICAGETVTLSVSQGGSSNTACAELPTNLQTGLVGYWPFCGNANDESGNGNNGTVNGATLTTDRFGNSNSAYHFTGVNCCGTPDPISEIAVESPFLALGGDYTISCWMSSDDIQKYQQCLFNSINHTGFAVELNNEHVPSRLSFGVGPANAFWDLLYAPGGNSSYVNNQWYNVGFVKSGTTYKMYLNGQLDYSTVISNSSNYNQTVGLRIGSIGGGHENFKGMLDDYAVWNRALSVGELQELLNITDATASSGILWSTGATTPTISVSPTTTTTYTCTTTTNGVSCTDSVTVVVNNPTIDLGNDVTACGTSTTLTAPTGYDSYLWSNGGTTNTTTVSANGTYSCTVTQGGCSASDSIDVTLIDATISASANTVCSGTAVTITASANGLIESSQDTLLVETTSMNMFYPFSYTSTALQSNVNYLLKVYGTVGFAGNIDSQDAAFQYNWFGSPVSPYPFPNASSVWWFVNGSNLIRPTPDIYNPSHIYYFNYTGNGQPLNISWTDSPYSDNSGQLNFALYRLSDNVTTTYLWSNGATTPSITVSPTTTTTYTCTTTTNGVSCSSNYTITVNNSSASTNIVTAFDSFTWLDGNTYTESNNTATYTTTNAAGCDSVISLNLTITPSSPTLALQVFLDGYYINSLNPAAMTAARYNNLVASGSTNPGANTDVDVITVELRSPYNLDVVAYSVSPILQTNGSAQCVFPAGALGGTFYLVVKHRATNPLWSANPIILTTSTTYDFANNLGSAYSDGDLSLAPMHTIVSGLYGIWLGELNDDGYLDATDYSNLELDIYASGYLGLYLLDGDLNGDTYVDASDFAVFESNSIYGPYEQRPYAITTNVSIGQSYQGGIVAYILQPGDIGYDANLQHGLIAAPSDQGIAQWGCFGTEISGADATAIGTGAQNTIDIMNGCSEAGIAARLCGDLILDGYSDWYLPSLDELNKLYLNKVAIGGFAAGNFPISIYWSSTAFNNGNNDAAWGLFFYDGIQYPKAKVDYLSVRAVRAF